MANRQSIRTQQRQGLRQSQRMAAKLIAAGSLLELSHLELRQAVEDEMAANPALELMEQPTCRRCGAPLRHGLCPNCQQAAQSWTDTDNYQVGRIRPADTANSGFEAEAPISLQDSLRLQARLALHREDYPLAEYLIANVNDRGLLECDLQEAAEAFSLSVEMVEKVLSRLQRMEPTGVASRTVQECLLVQLEELAAEGVSDLWAQRIISLHWPQLAERNYRAIARSLGISYDQVEQSAEFIRNNLDPYPGREFRSPWSSQPANPDSLRRPDVIVKREQARLEVEVVESEDLLVRVNESYRQLYRSALQAQALHDQQEVEYIHGCLQRAEWLIDGLRLRRRTMAQASEGLIKLQQAFFDTEREENLVPLTRSRLADFIGKHQSTISRAIANKFIMLPSGQIWAFERLFGSCGGVRGIIADLVERENARAPLTDEMIAQLLAARGHRVARRTVAKYRSILQIPAASERRKQVRGTGRTAAAVEGMPVFAGKAE